MPYKPEKNITPGELFSTIKEILKQQSEPTVMANRMMHDVLVMACHEALSDEKMSFGNLFSQVDYLCKRHNVSVKDIISIQQMRRDSNRSRPLLPEELLYDCRALALFISAISHCDIPGGLLALLPAIGKPSADHQEIDYRCVRCIVRSVSGSLISVIIDQDGQEREALADCSAEHLSYLRQLLRPGMQLNLIDCKETARRKAGDEKDTRAGGEAIIVPSLVIIEPDCLIDISSVAACFKDYGHYPLEYLMRLLKPKANTQAILIGNFAGSALDDIINSTGAYSWQETFRNNFKERALDYCTCADLNEKEDFKEAAKRQTDNIKQIVSALFGPDGGAYDRRKALLEPSFVCEELGLQGRVDLMTTDMELLVEQKSGKNWNIESGRRNIYGSFQKEEHYVQLLLYYGVLRQNFRLSSHQTDARLMYSRYPLPGGLVAVNFYRELFREAIKVRNEIVSTDFAIARDGFWPMTSRLEPSCFLQDKRRERFFNTYIAAGIEAVNRSLQELKPLERAYMNVMMTFVYREQLASRLGSQEGQGTHSADMWNMPLAEKKESGAIYTDLSIIKKEQSTSYNGFDTITLAVPDQGEDFLPNFREGDFVYLYAYRRGAEPDVRRSILFKGSLVEIRTDRLVVHLSDGQQNPEVISGELFAIEHSDIGGQQQVRSMAQFAAAPPSRRDLLLGQRPPRRDPSASLSRPYSPHYDDILLRAKQAKDYFLLVGPPGTGKTSQALQFLVREELAAEGHSVLLLAYTNRAVDEICGMLEDNHLDYIRLGQEFSCDARYRPHLLKYAIEKCPSLREIKARITSTRVFAATTTTMQSCQQLFSLKHFSLAVIDEASQILEPNIIGLLSAYDDGPCIERFILVGDHKQLPAVVQQNRRETQVSDPLLTSVCLDDCRSSLFERLLRWERKQGRTDFIGILRRQGRMHPDIAEFPNSMFYSAEQLIPVPLEHQKETALSYTEPSLDGLDSLLKSHRVVFIPSEDCRAEGVSDKVNTAEAAIVADLLRRIRRFYGPHFDARKTVGVIVPYRNQIAMIRREAERMGVTGIDDVSIDTVERYQGSQRDVIIYSFTVQRQYQLDFLTANTFTEDGHLIDRKLNVAMTRARRQLIMTGNVRTLSLNPLFKSLISFVTARGGMADG